jgi:hypothetical protein
MKNMKFAVLAIVPVLALSTLAMKAQQKPVMVHAPLSQALTPTPTPYTTDPSTGVVVNCCNEYGCTHIEPGPLACA